MTIKIKLPKGRYKIEGNKIEIDHKSIEGKLDVSKRIQRRNSKKVRVKRK